MKLAYFSPLPPQKSGISDYSEALLPYLSRYFDIDLWVTADTPDSALSKKYRIIDYHKSKAQISKLENYDFILYNLGNNMEFHAEMFEAFLKYPGYIILHDFVLYFLITGYFLEYKKDRENYIREFYENYGNEGIYDVKKILRGNVSPLQFPNPERFPLIKKIIQLTPGIIVHSESTKKLLMMNGYPPNKIKKINQVNYSNMNFAFSRKEIQNIKKRFGITDNTLLITSLGYIAPTKRNAQIIKAINEIISSSHVSIQYLMVGEGNYIDGLLNQYIKKTGFVSRDDYEKLVSCSDIVINMRNPSMGETSATLLQAMTAGKPCIVSDIAWFSELPENSVLKISIDAVKENNDLKQSLMLLISDKQKRTDLSKNAQEYVLKFHNPSFISEEIAQFLNGDIFCRANDLEPYYSEITTKRIQEIFGDNCEDLPFKGFMKNTTMRLKDIGLKQNKKNPESWFSYYIQNMCMILSRKLKR